MTAEQELHSALSRIVQLAQSRGLPETEAASGSEAGELQVRGQCFARILNADNLLLECPLEQKAMLLAMSPTIYFETEHYVGQSVVLVHLGRISDEELSLRLEDSWRHKAPHSLAQTLPLMGQTET